VAVSIAGVWFTIIKDKAPLLERAEQEEQELKLTFENKQRKAANYDAYRAQLQQIEQSFGTMLRQLPGETEIPSLIVDISQAGLAAGLQEKLFRPEAEIPKDFYAEKPIRIRLSGGYHEIANFVSGIAALPRIVTLHNIDITREDNTAFDRLSLEVTAKTYRYLEEAQ
jgi:type IV pilus assembly protein PilO